MIEPDDYFARLAKRHNLKKLDVISSMGKLQRGDFESRYVTVPEAGCWLWIGSINAQGYGRFSLGSKGQSTMAHRESYRRYIGPIPDGLFVCHKCDTPACINPSHLFVGTQLDNQRDRASKGRSRGEWNGRSHLTEEQVLEIRSSDLPDIHFSRLLGIPRSTIAEARLGHTWKHLPNKPNTARLIRTKK